MPPLNLDYLAACASQSIVDAATTKAQVKTLERVVTKSLGVLQGHGLYGCLVFLFSRSKDEAQAAGMARAGLFKLLGDLPNLAPGAPAPEAPAQTALAYFSRSILQDLDTLLLVRDLYEQALIYARYYAKARGE